MPKILDNFTHSFTDDQVKAEDLLKNMFPNVEHVRALVKGRRVVDHLEDVTIMFSDLKGYTQWASEESPKEVYRVLNKVCAHSKVETYFSSAYARPYYCHSRPATVPTYGRRLLFEKLQGRASPGATPSVSECPRRFL